MRLLFLALLSFIVSTGSLSAQEPKFLEMRKPQGFDLPIQCQIGADCWVMNYVDYGPDDGKKTDMACLGRTYDGHKGTDFAIIDDAAMRTGVNVVAPRDGTILKVRDGELDQWSTPEQIEYIKKQRKECGNAIMIDHGSDVKTIYCHLKKNSIVVKQGQVVKTGDKLAQVGLSGMTEFPHLHFGVLKKNKVLDPFTGYKNNQKCGRRGTSLWNKNVKLDYQPVVIQSLGFSQNIPKLDDIEQDASSPKTLSLKEDKIMFWMVLLGVQEKDEIDILVKDSNGKNFIARRMVQDKTRARQFYYAGKKLEGKRLPEGAYIGEVRVTRPDKDYSTNSFQAILVEK